MEMIWSNAGTISSVTGLQGPALAVSKGHPAESIRAGQLRTATAKAVLEEALPKLDLLADLGFDGISSDDFRATKCVGWCGPSP